MEKKYVAVSAAGILLLMCLCYHGVPQKDRLAYVGATLITRLDASAFSSISQYYPNPPEEFFLGTRPQIGAIIETEAIYRSTRWNLANIKLRNSLEWKWRERYYIATLFSEKILRGNLGRTDKELLKYYNTNKKSFAPMAYDSTGKPCSTSIGTPQPFEQVKGEIAEKLFLASTPPDSAFKNRIHTVDTSMVVREWLRFMRGGDGMREVFLKKFFKEKYGRSYPDSLRDIYGKGKFVTPEDMDVMLSWIPENRREQIKNNPQGLNDLASWLLRWKLFSEKAASTGFTSQPDVQSMLKWVWRFEIAQRYINEKIAPMVNKGVHIDTAMTLYAYWDETETPGPIDSAGLKNTISKHFAFQRTVKFDSLIYELRKDQGVRFLTDWKDDKAIDPAVLLRRADSLRDTGNTLDAQNAYQTMVDNYFFTKEGKKAIIEIAKIKTEQQMYREAVNNYRRFLVDGADQSKKCNYMFMIGFIYDEYCDKPALAEVNYKWVLKNTPDCELADDAEFMMLHLGEQMAGVDELQSEVRRQGKKVEAGESDTAGLKVEMMPATQKK